MARDQSSVGHKSLYVKESDLELWDRAKALADRKRLTMSALVMTALEAYLAEHDDAKNE